MMEMMNWKAGLVAVLVGAGAVCVGCGGEVPQASAGDGPATEASRSIRLATADFAVEGMTCGGCAIATEMSVRKLEGVASVDASYDEESGQGRCFVEYDPEMLGVDAIAEAIRAAGFEPTLRSTENGD